MSVEQIGPVVVGTMRFRIRGVEGDLKQHYRVAGSCVVLGGACTGFGVGGEENEAMIGTTGSLVRKTEKFPCGVEKIMGR